MKINALRTLLLPIAVLGLALTSTAQAREWDEVRFHNCHRITIRHICHHEFGVYRPGHYRHGFYDDAGFYHPGAFIPGHYRGGEERVCEVITNRERIC